MNLYEERVCTNCGNNNCTHKIKEVQKENETIIKCDDFICKNKRKKMPRNWQEWQETMLEALIIILIIIFSPVILIAGIFSLFIILGLIITVLGIIFGIVCIPIGLVKMLIDKVKERMKDEY